VRKQKGSKEVSLHANAEENGQETEDIRCTVAFGRVLSSGDKPGARAKSTSQMRGGVHPRLGFVPLVHWTGGGWTGSEFLLLALSCFEFALLFFFGIHLDPNFDVAIPFVSEVENVSFSSCFKGKSMREALQLLQQKTGFLTGKVNQQINEKSEHTPSILH
jgi:hypothetical protein